MMMAFRSLSAGIVLYALGRFRGDADATRRELPPLILIGLLFFLIGHGGIAWAQRTVPSGVASLLVAFEPVIIALFEPLFTREGTVGKRTLLGMLIGIVGVVVLLIPHGLDFKNTNVTGSLVILFCASSWATGAIYSRVALLPRSPFIRSGMQLLSGGVMLIIVSYLLGEWTDFSFSQITARSWSGLAYHTVWLNYRFLRLYLVTVDDKRHKNLHSYFYQPDNCSLCRLGYRERGTDLGDPCCYGAHCGFGMAGTFQEVEA